MNLVLLEPDEVAPHGLAILSGHRAAHVAGVLGARAGDTVRAGLVDGPVGTAVVRETHGQTVTLQCAFDARTPPLPPVDLLLALPRPKVLKRLWAQFAAIGVGRIILTNAARVERNYFDTHVLDEAFFRPLLIEGLQQARDTRLPRVSIHRCFRPLIEDELDGLSDAGVRIVADPSGGERIGDVVPRLRTEAPAGPGRTAGERVLLAIGPEGGWVPFELELLARHRFIACGMGPRTLRTDTACIALLALVHEAMRG